MSSKHSHRGARTHKSVSPQDVNFASGLEMLRATTRDVLLTMQAFPNDVGNCEPHTARVLRFHAEVKPHNRQGSGAQNTPTGERAMSDADAATEQNAWPLRRPLPWVLPLPATSTEPEQAAPKADGHRAPSRPRFANEATETPDLSKSPPADRHRRRRAAAPPKLTRPASQLPPETPTLDRSGHNKQRRHEHRRSGPRERQNSSRLCGPPTHITQRR